LERRNLHLSHATLPQVAEKAKDITLKLRTTIKEKI